jgi:hypothetical protein
MACTSAPRTTSPETLEGTSTLRGALVGYSQKMGVRGWSGFGWQIVLLLPLSLLYFFVRDLSAGQESEAYANAATIVNLQQTLGLDWESTLQQRILDTDWVVAGVNWIYIWGHFPVIILSLFLLFGLSRHNFITLRNALVISGTIGLVCFALYPVAPPRLFNPDAFFDSLGELSGSYRILQNPKITNQFAAVPSFHVGWNILVAVAVWRSTRFIALRALALASPLLMMTAVVLTANHWLLDVVAGISVALAGILGARLIERLFARFTPTPTPAVALDGDESGGSAVRTPLPPASRSRKQIAR